MKAPLILWQDDVSGVIARRGQALVASLLVGKERYRNLQVGIEQNKTTVIAETTTNMIDMISNLEEKKISPTGQERTKFAYYHLAKEKVPCLSLYCGNLRRGDESQPLAGFVWSGLPPFLLLPATRSLFKAHYLYNIYIYIYI